MKVDGDKLIGSHVKYYDYLGIERFGTIVAVEPYIGDLAYVYIEDEEQEENIHSDMVNGAMIKYAELRASDEVYLDR